MTTLPSERWRVNQLADRCGLSVDTIRFYQKRGLLPPPDRVGRVGLYGPVHEERLARVRDLQARGFTLAVIRRLLEGELDPSDLPLVAAVAADGEGDEPERFLSLGQVADRSGVPLALVEAVAAEGFLVPRRHNGAERYTEGDVEIVGAALRLLEAGLPLPDLLAVARLHHDSTRVVAEAAVEMFDEHVRRPLLTADASPEDRAERLVDAFRVLLPSVTALVAHHFRRVLLEVAQEHIEAVGDPAERAAVDAEGGRALEGRLA